LVARSKTKAAARREPLSARVIESARPEDTQYRIWDTKVPGLYLRVLPSGVKSWYVQWSRTGTRAIGKWPGMTVDTARTQSLAALNDAATNGTPEIAKPKTHSATLGDLIDVHYAPWVEGERKTGRATVARIKAAFSEFLPKPLDAINLWVIDKWRMQRRKEKIEPSTINRDLAALRAALSKAVEWKLIAVHPLAGVKATKVEKDNRIRYLTAAEDSALRGALAERDRDGIAARARANAWRSERDYAQYPDIPVDGFIDHLTPMVLLALNTGMRRGELTGLTWADVNMPGKIVTVRAATAKAGKTRHIPLNMEAVGVLTKLRAQQGKDGRLFDVQSVKKSWAGLLDKAKVSDFRFHDCRHDFASKLVMAGVDLNTVRELLGHADIKMTLRYAHLAPEHKAAAVEKLGVGR
jgi:integrase